MIMLECKAKTAKRPFKCYLNKGKKNEICEIGQILIVEGM